MFNISKQYKKLHTWYIHVQVGEFIFNIHNLSFNSKPIKSQESYSYICLQKSFLKSKGTTLNSNKRNLEHILL